LEMYCIYSLHITPSGDTNGWCFLHASQFRDRTSWCFLLIPECW
jgi:hypothetical protein